MTIEGNQIPVKTIRLRDLGCPLRGWPTGPLALSRGPPLEPGPGCSHVSWNRPKTALGPSPGPGSRPAGQGSGAPPSTGQPVPREAAGSCSPGAVSDHPGVAARGRTGAGKLASVPLGPGQITRCAPKSRQLRRAKTSVAVRACALAPALLRHAGPEVSMTTVWRLASDLYVWAWGAGWENECSVFHQVRGLQLLQLPLRLSIRLYSLWAWEWTWGSPASVAAPRTSSILCLSLGFSQQDS